MPATTQGSQLVSWLRAAGEPSRLRLLFLCSHRDFSVSDLATTLEQSEPRVSRHLRILSEAGLVERVRHGQWVHYRLSEDPAAAGFVQGLLGQLDRAEPQLTQDLQRIMPFATASEFAQESRLGRALDDFLGPLGAAGEAGYALVLGVQHLELLERVAATSRRCVAVAHSRRVAQTARTFAARLGLHCVVLVSSASEGPAERDIERALRAAACDAFDVVIVDRLGGGGDPSRVLTRAARSLAAHGRLWLFEDYEALESGGGKVVEHPLARLRRLLGSAGLSCERLSPIEADGRHVLAALAAPAMERHETTMRRA